MHRRLFAVILGIACASALAGQTGNAKLDIDLNYTGAGAVDSAHKIVVVLWDTPDFVKGDGGSAPIAVKTATSKSGVIHLEDLQSSPVYISMVYDASGTWDAASPPPSGSPVGMYSTEPGTPAPVKLDPGKTTKVSATFDDSQKMP